MPQVHQYYAMMRTRCDVGRQVFGLGGVSKILRDDDFPPDGSVPHNAIIAPFLTAARQLQIRTGFPINSQDRQVDATGCNKLLSRRSSQIGIHQDLDI